MSKKYKNEYVNKYFIGDKVFLLAVPSSRQKISKLLGNKSF